MSAHDSYSRSEVDLKLENLEQRLENKLDRVLSSIEILSNHVDAQLQAQRQETRQELGWIKTLLISSNLAILIALGGVILPIAWVLWSFAVHFPGK